MWTAVVVGIIPILMVAGAGVYLWRENANDELRHAINKALMDWQKTDEKLGQYSQEFLNGMHEDLNELLKYSKKMSINTFGKIQDLRKRVVRILDGKEHGK